MAANTSLIRKPIECFPKSTMNSISFYHGDDPLMHALPVYMLQSFTIVAITCIVRRILKPFGQPRIVSELIGGIIVGPSVLGRYKVFVATVFPRHGDYVMQTLGRIGPILFYYLNGVKQDVGLLREAGRKEWAMAVFGWLSSEASVNIVYFSLQESVKETLPPRRMFISFASNTAATSLASIYPVIAELNLLNSDLGRMALSVALITDIGGWVLFVIFEAVRKGLVHPKTSVLFVVSIVAQANFIVFVIRPVMLWIVRKTPKGRLLGKVYVAPILLTAMLMACSTSIFGTTTSVGAMLTGLVTPEGPPLGSKLVENVEDLTNYSFLPLYFVVIGSWFNVLIISSWKRCAILQMIFATGFIGKMVGIVLPCLYFKIPLRDSLLLGLMLNFRGLTEVGLYRRWVELKMADDETLVVLIFAVLMMNGVAALLLTVYAGSSMVYVTYNRRTIEHSKPETELKLLTCIHEQDNVPILMKLLEASNATEGSPICVYVLYLVELVGRLTPLLISHSFKSLPSNMSSNKNPIINAFQNYGRHKSSELSIQPFTTISPYKTMHEDICKLAFDKKVSLIILPFHKQRMIDGQMVLNPALKRINPNVLAKAPCSVGILVDRGIHQTRTKWVVPGEFSYRTAIIFIGGADDREALSYAFRMATHPGVSVTMVQFLPAKNVEDANSDKELDGRLVEAFKIKAADNAAVICKEKVVKDGEEMLSVLRSLGKGYDLIMTGRQHNSVLLEGLSEWNEDPELGVIGDLLASLDFLGGNVSVLVLQQQRNRHAVVFKAPRK